MYCTTGRRADGFGAHFQNILVDILYTYNATTDHRYVFPNIASFEHNYANEPDFADRLVRYMNLRDHFSLKSDSADTSANIHQYSVSNYTYVENNLTQLLASPTMNLIKSLFYADKKTPYDTAYYNVAVHVRRHNKEDNRIDGTNTPDEYYLNVMKYIRASNTEKPLRFHIYSQCSDAEGAETEFKEKFMNTDVEFHLNGDVIPTFHGMVFGDALVTSASSYSYCASFLCNGVVYYKRFWHKPSNNWIVGDYLSS
jgi:hypothetical protein